jgi:hypothetical protein
MTPRHHEWLPRGAARIARIASRRLRQHVGCHAGFLHVFCSRRRNVRPARAQMVSRVPFIEGAVCARRGNAGMNRSASSTSFLDRPAVTATGACSPSASGARRAGGAGRIVGRWNPLLPRLSYRSGGPWHSGCATPCRYHAASAARATRLLALFDFSTC